MKIKLSSENKVLLSKNYDKPCNCHVGRKYPRRTVEDVVVEAIMESFESGERFEDFDDSEAMIVLHRPKERH